MGTVISMHSQKQNDIRLPPEVNRVIFVRNLPYNITGDYLYEIFGKYGTIRQIRIGNSNDTKGSAYVVFEDIFDARAACEHLSGYNVQGRYLILLFHHDTNKDSKEDMTSKEMEVRTLTQK